MPKMYEPASEKVWHGGMVKAFWFEGYELRVSIGENTLWGYANPSNNLSFPTKYDAGYVYDALRDRHPEKENEWLHVRVLTPDEMSADDRKAVYSRKLDQAPAKAVEGLLPISLLEWRGARPRVPGKGGQLQIMPIGDTDLDEYRKELEDFAPLLGIITGERLEWKEVGVPV